MAKDTDITGIDIISLADEAISARDAMLEAAQMKCTCSGFQLQYDGCSCERSKKVKIARKMSDDFFAGL